jgi:hypothetical protein
MTEPKFKVGDKVKVLDKTTLLTSQIKQRGKTLEIVEVYGQVFGYYLSDCTDTTRCPIYFEDELELVGPEKEETKYFKYYVRGLPREIPIKLSQNIELVEPKKEEPKHDKAFDLDPHEFEKTKTPFSDIDDSIKYILKSIESPYIPLEYKILNGSVRSGKAFDLDPHEFGGKKRLKDYSDKELIGIISKSFNDFYKNLDFTKSFPYYHLSLDEALHTRPSKNRIPDRVVFNEAKGKVTVLMSKHLDGEAPYRAYTSKVNVESGDKFDAQFGFLLSYYKYLIRSLSGDVQKEMIERIFKLVPSKRYAYLLGVVENEVLKIECVKSYKDWQDIYMAITETPKTSLNVYNYTWDYLEWQEMLRVHELELKREKAREVRKQIKAHEKEIAKLKKEV